MVCSSKGVVQVVERVEPPLQQLALRHCPASLLLLLLLQVYHWGCRPRSFVPLLQRSWVPVGVLLAVLPQLSVQCPLTVAM